jgi:A/G-specific adenine glycosylase
VRNTPERKLRFRPTSPLNGRVRAASRFASQLVAWFHGNKRDLPWRRTRDPYAIWVSEIMLQQTQVKTVIPYWECWMREMPTIDALAKAKPDRVLKLWEGLGYYSRARNLQKAAQQIVEKSGGQFPNAFEEILELPGIGRYTAGAIGSIAFGLSTPIVDGNVVRVLARYLGLRGDPKSRETSAVLWESAAKLVQAAYDFGACGDLNEALMELGATICLPKNPQCEACPVRQKCFARKNGQTATLPEVVPRAPGEIRIFRAALIRVGEKILLRQRPTNVVNARFWELPNIEAKGESPAESFQRLLERPISNMKRLCEVKHTIMRFRITLEIFEIEGKSFPDCKRLDVSDLRSIPVVSAHRRALAKLGYLKDRLQEQQKT